MKKKTTQLAMHSIRTKFDKRGDCFVVYASCLFRFVDEQGKAIDPGKIKISIGNNEACGTLKIGKARNLMKGIKLGKYEIAFNEKDLADLDIQNKMQLRYGDTVARIGYSAFDRSKGKQKTSRIIQCGELACYVKQSIYNGMYLTVREPQIYDQKEMRSRVRRAWLLAKIWPKNDIIYMFEKECSRYEESASVLYEKLIDEGHDNVYYIVNEDNRAIQNLDERYKANLIYKDSFKHLLYFFKSKVFIGTETMAHAMLLRASDKHIVLKTESRRIKYVFLQHGVMYMVSLNADLRVSFRQKGLDLYRVVVSSEREAQHFIDLADFEREELYVTGLAMFDKIYRYENADRIVIMPTWRRWEFNAARQDVSKTKYYQMIERMVEAVPEHLREKIVILPHPLMQAAMNRGENPLGKYLATDSHDHTLRSCDLLITDYSSVAYDAFYRGCNVIFCWGEKDECMKCYGEETRLMLSKDLAFGDICYNEAELRTSIENLYGHEQRQEDTDKYRQIVSYHDGRNAERIMDMLKKDGVL